MSFRPEKNQNIDRSASLRWRNLAIPIISQLDLCCSSCTCQFPLSVLMKATNMVCSIVQVAELKGTCGLTRGVTGIRFPVSSTFDP